MKLIETTFTGFETYYQHRVEFLFEERRFLALVEETKDETFIMDCYEVKENMFPIDIPKYFGEFKTDVYTFIYDNIQRGFPQ